MTRTRASRFALITLALASAVQAQDFPRAPSTSSAAEAAGLRRLDATELSVSVAGTRLVHTAKGEVISLQLRPDGSLNYADDKGVTDSGSWSVTTRSGGTLCWRHSRQMGGRACAVYYAAPDGLHWFGYDPDTERWTATTRPQLKE